MLQELQGKNVLLTTNNWFYAPDGRLYRSVWGKISLKSDAETLGIKTNMRSTNWYAVIGSDEKALIVAGCQIHYVCLCNQKPNTDLIQELRFSETLGLSNKVDILPAIYLAQ
jgi:hypothetical protein